MTIADKLTLLASSKEALRVKLGLPKSLPFSEYYKHGYPFDPLTLFAGGKQGVWLDPSDKSTLFQDVAGTVPVTTDGDPVALMKDKSGNGNHATQTVSASRPVYKTDGILHWLEFDGTDDFMKSTYASAVTSPTTLAVGVDLKSQSGARVFITGLSADARHQISRTLAGLLAAYGGTGGILSDATKIGMYILVSHLNGAFSDLVDNNKVIKGSLSSNSIKGMTIGAVWDGTSSVNADFYGIIQVEGLADTTDLQKYLRAKMGVI